MSLNYAPELTATGKFTGEMAAWFAARGHEVDAIAGMPHYPDWQVDPEYRQAGMHTEVLDGVRVRRVLHFVPQAAHVTAWKRILMECSFTIASQWWWLRIMLQRRRYDVVVAVCPPMQDAIMPWLYGRLRRVPWVFHIQDFQVDAALRLRMLTGDLLGRALFAVENFLLRRASSVSTITEAMRQRAVEKGAVPRAVWLVPNWADTSAIRPGSRHNNFRNALGLRADQMLVMYAGGMGAKQGLEVVISAADALRDEPDIQFLLVGGGADRERLGAMVCEKKLANVRFLPVQPSERLNEMLAAGDIHLVIQRAEAADMVMPSKLANILAAGRPCIATAECGTTLHSVLTNNDCGIAVQPSSAEMLRDAIERLCRDPRGRDRMGGNAHAYANAYLRKDLILGRFEAQLQKLIAE